MGGTNMREKGCTGGTPVLRGRERTGGEKVTMEIRTPGVCQKSGLSVYEFPGTMKPHFVGYPSFKRLVPEAQAVATQFGD